MIASAGETLSSKVDWKNSLLGFPTSVAVHCAAYSKPFTKHPGPKDSPSVVL